MRLVAQGLVLISVLGCLAGCAPVHAVQPTPTPVSLKPANLLTPRPALSAQTPTAGTAEDRQAATTDRVAVAVPRAVPTRTPTVEPTPAVRVTGTPVAASEPLQGFLLDDSLWSPIIG